MKPRKITDEVVRLYKLAREIEDAGASEKWEENGGRRNEYFDIKTALHNALGLKVHEPSPLDTFGPPPEWMTRPDERADWRKADVLYKRIEAVLRPEQ